MRKQIFITDKELKNYGNIATLSDKAHSLLIHQKENWELVGKNFNNLEQVKIKYFNIEGYELKVQFNPSRIVSSSAKIDKKSLKKRACFLCAENLPAEQKGIKYKNDYIILVNPFPIFTEHLTIPKLEHVPQSIENSFEDLLMLSFDLKDNFFVFYNGPKCGASAPDHLHFQAGIKNYTPLEKFYKTLTKNNGTIIFRNESTKVCIIKTIFQNFIYISTSSKDSANNHFEKLLSFLKTLDINEAEPKLNIVSFYEDDKWNIFVFPRFKHRPEQYFYEDERKILFSPAAAEMTGVCILPREEDFGKITKAELLDMFNQVKIKSAVLDKLTI